CIHEVRGKRFPENLSPGPGAESNFELLPARCVRVARLVSQESRLSWRDESCSKNERFLDFARNDKRETTERLFAGFTPKAFASRRFNQFNFFLRRPYFDSQHFHAQIIQYHRSENQPRYTHESLADNERDQC